MKLDEKAQTILDALTGVSRAEWEIVREYIDRQYAAQASEVRMTQEGARDVIFRLAVERGIGRAEARQGSRQERMF
jgi:hypothetical protein